MILVVAGNKKQFEFYKKENHWNDDYVYLSHMKMTHGRVYDDIITVGEFWLHDIMNEFTLSEIKRRCLRINNEKDKT